MALIEREALREKAIECGKLAKQDPRLLVVGLGYVLDAPAIDAAPVVHGWWKYFHKQNRAVCTKCSFERDLDLNFGRAISCPNCGARMGGEGT